MANTVNLATKFLPYVDEIFKNESKISLLTNQDFDWTGAHTVKVYKVSTSAMNDYGRSGPADGNWSRYGAVAGLDAVSLVEGRICYDAFVLDNKKSAIYYQAVPAVAGG